MKKHKKSMMSARGKFGLSLFAVFMAVAVLAIGAVTVASRQKEDMKHEDKFERGNYVTDKSKANVPIIRVVNHDGHLDRAIGQIQELSPEEAQKVAAGLKQMVNDSPDGLTPVQHPDGSVSVDLKGRFRNVTVARVNADGSVSQSCVNNRQAAGAFFGIDPKLIDSQPDTKRKARID